MNAVRAQSPYSFREKAQRLRWAAVQATFFHSSFHSSYRWRRWLPSAFGARLDPVLRIRRSVRIECPWYLRAGRDSDIGDHAEAMRSVALWTIHSTNSTFAACMHPPYMD
jgi:hypothetical protein